ncbi:MAG: YihA family ribosome biogenesis GTP-binding protein [Gammaproteobacteria bacterium RIFCSPHIGHO2_12_FULL_43_28]|nr:MAG: YihA family ribosome biogenesis GTP-binding protein [Gammaproteobacteria bacterium RIFCSPHIGHO2_12_FULL_43_28]
MSSLYQNAEFLLSAADIKQLPADKGVEVAIVGRSNAGKSSVLNRLTNQKGLARVSKTPGRTQLVNVFVLDEARRIIDLPGYGFANVPIAAQEKWQRTVDAYIQKRESLQGLILVMDIRHPLKPLDKQLLHYCDNRDLPVHILLNKADKLSKGAAQKTKLEVLAALTDAYRNMITLQTFSAMKNEGIKELHLRLNEWYDC